MRPECFRDAYRLAGHLGPDTGLRWLAAPAPKIQTACVNRIMSELVETIRFQIKAVGLTEPVMEYPFCHEIVKPGPGIRKRLQEKGLKNWRFDLAWPELKLAVECEGGAFTSGGHTRGPGFRSDMIKYGTAMYYGWTVYRCDMKMIKTGLAIKHVEKLHSKLSANPPQN